MSRRSILSNAGWLAGDRVVRLGGGLLVGVWMARYLGPSDFGLLNYTIAFSSVFGILSTLGLDGIVVREIVNRRYSEEALLGTAVRLRAVGALVAFAVAVGLAAATGSRDLTLAMISLSATVFLAQSLYVIDWHYQATANNRPSVIAQNIGFLISSAFKALMIVLEMPVIAFAITNVIEAVIASLMMWFLYRRTAGAAKWRFDMKIARDLVRESWPLILSGLAFMIYVRVDQIMIGKILGPAAVGVYAAAVRISEVWNMVPVIIVTAAFPRLLELRLTDQARYEANVQRLFSVLAGISIAAALGTQVLGPWAVHLLYGPAYQESAAILQISVWSAIFTSLGFASGRWLIAENMAKFALLRNAIGVVINIGVNLFLIPAMGAKGAALGTLISYIFANLLAYTTNRRLHPLFWINMKALMLIGVFPFRREAKP